MPLVGLGTSHSGGYSHEAVSFALNRCGYRLIDTAKRYGCEEMLRTAWQESSVNRGDLFLSTKLWPKDYGVKTIEALEGSLSRLGTNYLDLYLLHWPQVPSDCTDKWQRLSETWRALELAYDEGTCRAIGVSNFEVDDLDRMFDFCSIKPLVNQIEFHPYHHPITLLEYCEDNGIQVQGYCPLGKGQILADKCVIRVAAKHAKTPAQVLIRWALQQNVATVPKSTKIGRVMENMNVFNFELDAQDMEVLNNLTNKKRFVDPATIQDKIDSNLPDGYKLRL
jgi:diketogulonate reductase-like aldo/keto reductase